MLWRVENTDLQLIGSVHISNRVLTMHPAAVQAIESADMLAFEANFEAPPHLPQKFYKGKEILSDRISKPLFNDVREMWSALDLAVEDLERSRPWWAALYLTVTQAEKHGYVFSCGVDKGLIDFAKREKKDIFFLEKVNDGLVPLASAPLDEQLISLSSIVQRTEETIKIIASLVDAVEASKPELLLPVIDRMMLTTPITHRNLLPGRNKAWLRHLVRLAKSKKRVVAAVGALHMVGPESLPQLLTDAGFPCVFSE